MGVTGGLETPRLSAGSALAPKIKIVDVGLKSSAEALLLDWEEMVDEFGLIDKSDARLKNARPLKVDELSEFIQTGVQTKEAGEGEEGEDLEDGAEVQEEEEG